MIFDRIMLPAQGRSEDYKFAQTGSVTLAASMGGVGGGTSTPSWLENVITLDPESGFLSVDNWHVKGDLVIEGQVNQWLAQQLVVDDARIQVNRKQGGATVDSGLVIFDKDTSTEVSRLVFDVNGIWKAGGDRLFTEAYNPKLGGYAAGDYPRKAEDAVISGAWKFSGGSNYELTIQHSITVDAIPRSASLVLGRNASYHIWRMSSQSTQAWGNLPDLHFENKTTEAGAWAKRVTILFNGNVGINNAAPTERLHVVGNGLFTGNLTVGGNVGTSNFVSQMQGWRVTPAGVADFRHIYTDELQAKAFTADISQALVGSDVLTKSVAKLAQNWATTANGVTSTIYVEELEGFPGYQVFAVGDRLLLRLFDRSGGGLLIKNIWATVASYVSTTNNVQRYTITVNSGGVTGQTVYAGSMILDYGTPGSGVIERTVLDQQGSPYSRVSTWTGSPDNPANYTLHYQSGNLNGIPNAEGWGVYSENSFLTGKLLVGDLTKAGQYMEYKDGVLNIKGQITVTGGNAATKEDVDAIQVGGRNYALNTSTPKTKNSWTGANNQSLSLYVVNVAPEWEVGKQVTIAFDVEVSDLAWSGGTVRLASQSYGNATSYDGFGYYNFFSRPGSSGSGQSLKTRVVYQVTLTAAMLTNQRYTFSVRCDYITAGTLSIRNFALFYGNKATDWTPAPEDVPSALEYLATAIQDGSTEIEGGLINTNVLMVKDTAGDVVGGMSGLKSDNVGFWTGGTYQAAINNNANVIFRKDGSFSLAGGKITGTSDGALSVDAGVITGVIESSNYDGTVGSRFDLYNGHLLIGNAIRMSGDVSEIQVRNRDTGLDSFKIGDFILTPKDFAGAGVDVLLGSGSVTASAASGGFGVGATAYVSGTGNLSTSSSQRISNSLIVGGTYNFRTFLKITLSPYIQIGTEPGIIPEIFEYLSGSGIKMQLKNGNTVVWERSIYTIPPNGVIPLLISTSFQAVSSSLQLMMSISGEYRYRVPSGTNTRHYNVTASISRYDSSSRLVLQALINRMEFSTRGMQTVFSSSNYFRCDSTGIEGRGAQTFISPDGIFRLRISNDGIEKSTNGGTTWTPL